VLCVLALIETPFSHRVSPDESAGAYLRLKMVLATNLPIALNYRQCVSESQIYDDLKRHKNISADFSIDLF
jgi:hypothetical protein